MYSSSTSDIRAAISDTKQDYPQIADLSVNNRQTDGCWQSELEHYIQYCPTAYLKNPSVSYLAVGDDDLAKSGADSSAVTVGDCTQSCSLLDFTIRLICHEILKVSAIHVAGYDGRSAQPSLVPTTGHCVNIYTLH